MTNKKQIYLLLNDTLFLKGVAILCILLHNFFHFIPPVTYQNEMSLKIEYIFRFLHDFTIRESFNAIFSFFGFYGVYIFIFVSGYGLTKSFSRYSGKHWRFIFTHIAKIYALLLFCVAIFIDFNFSQMDYKSLFYVLSLSSNFSPKTLFILNGPWWFFSLIIQLYILFLPLYFVLKKDIRNILIVLLFYIILAFYAIPFEGIFACFYANSIGHIPEFALGILIALYEEKLPLLFNKRFNLIIFFISFLFIILAQFSAYAFVFSFMAAAFVYLTLYKLIEPKHRFFLEFTGKISPFLFGLNGFLFRNYFVVLARKDDDPINTIVYCFLWLMVNYIIAYASLRLVVCIKQQIQNLH